MNLDEINAKLKYENGNLYWKMQNRGMPRDLQKPAGFIQKNSKYVSIIISSKKYLVHRVIFFMHHNYLPEYIDHIDCNTLNNNIENLRAATKSQNNMNRTHQKNSTTKTKNVYMDVQKQKWLVRVVKNGVQYHGGFFDDIESAKKHVCEFRKKIHGEFANDR